MNFGNEYIKTTLDRAEQAMGTQLGEHDSMLLVKKAMLANVNSPRAGKLVEYFTM